MADQHLIPLGPPPNDANNADNHDLDDMVNYEQARQEHLAERRADREEHLAERRADREGYLQERRVDRDRDARLLALIFAMLFALFFAMPFAMLWVFCSLFKFFS
ncbi:hypothetical protein B0J14DRAFT_555663 [Halenospora varia]|nr:hypothetical protein B0J14DRAFT_555663 [Halenospora varia]